MALEFDPSSLLISNQLSPVAINSYPMPQQILWLYNPYASDIKLRLISRNTELAISNDDFVVKSHQHAPLLINFSPNSVGRHEVHRKIYK